MMSVGVTRKKNRLFLLFCLFFVVSSLILYWLYVSRKHTKVVVRTPPVTHWLNYEEFVEKCGEKLKTTDKTERRKKAIHISLSHCAQNVKDPSDRLKETTNLIKSAIYMTSSEVHFHIITDSKETVSAQLEKWSRDIRHKFHYTFYKPCWSHPSQALTTCSEQRLFLPYIIPYTDQLIHLDTDTLILAPLDDVWSHFNNFTAKQVLGLARESEMCDGWYEGPGRSVPRPAGHGYNSGVAILKLDRLRDRHWYSNMSRIYMKQTVSEHEDDFISAGEQDYINEYFHNYPDHLYTLPCSANFRRQFCEECFGTKQTCEDARTRGVSILHAQNQGFHKNTMFNALHRVMTQLDLKTSKPNYMKAVKQMFERSSFKESCPQDIFTKRLR